MRTCAGSVGGSLRQLPWPTGPAHRRPPRGGERRPLENWSIMRDARLQQTARALAPALGARVAWGGSGLPRGNSAELPLTGMRRVRLYVPGGQHGRALASATMSRLTRTCGWAGRRRRMCRAQLTQFLLYAAGPAGAGDEGGAQGRTRGVSGGDEEVRTAHGRACLPPTRLLCMRRPALFSGGGCFDEAPLRHLLRGVAEEHYGSGWAVVRVGGRQAREKEGGSMQGRRTARGMRAARRTPC